MNKADRSLRRSIRAGVRDMLRSHLNAQGLNLTDKRVEVVMNQLGKKYSDKQVTRQHILAESGKVARRLAKQ